MHPQVPDGGRTLVYSVVGDHEIKLDYYLPHEVAGRLPALIYYHGGGMTAGSRRGMGFPYWLYDHCQEKGWIFIAADYRLCHPSTTLDQIADAKALLQFLAGEQFKRQLPESVFLDTARIAVTGFSAGAYSARAACIYAEPKPAVLLSVYGLGGNMLLDHWTKGRPPTSIAKLVDLRDVPGLLADKTVVSDDVSAGRMSKRFALTVHWEIEGTFLDGCFGKPGLGRELDAVAYELRATALPEDVKRGMLQLFVTDKYPPSVFVHGLADEVVSPQESIDHHEQLTKLGVKSELHLVKDGPHGLREFTPGAAPEMAKATAEAYNRALLFITDVLSPIN
ncbi:alpha/beta-hydrolase [Penicillium hispanicum]|uniref:alpha/beta-hydrolase n=1 Tax=Penicillium hispanicum TaxID=1080232 RepID=UPI0025423078|nr:alpha/beta-hydrolase [Penicillium hispanicum]KAJ5595350.1 alpha/beta-hydrolase [Penicillium hispanicum]